MVSLLIHFCIQAIPGNPRIALPKTPEQRAVDCEFRSELIPRSLGHVNRNECHTCIVILFFSFTSSTSGW